jgi:hypothetical protein
MTIALGLALTVIWTIAPNIPLLAFTRDEDSHLAWGAACFIPWTLFGLYLAG